MAYTGYHLVISTRKQGGYDAHGVGVKFSSLPKISYPKYRMYDKYDRYVL